MINIISSSRYKIERKKLKLLIGNFLMTKGFSEAHVLNIIFVGRNKMRDIAKKYKHEDMALPVLSFPYKNLTSEVDNLIGEVFICYPQAVLLAAERSRRVNEIIVELIKHGVNNLI